MRKLALAAALVAAFSAGAWGQAPPPGTYQFISGPGVGQPTFTVSGFSTSLGGSVTGIHVPNCAGIHVHGTFNGFPDTNPGGCGHGIIQLVVPPPSVSGGGLPGGMPSNVAGQLALTSPAGSALVQDIFLGVAGKLEEGARPRALGLGERIDVSGIAHTGVGLLSWFVLMEGKLGDLAVTGKQSDTAGDSNDGALLRAMRLLVAGEEGASPFVASATSTLVEQVLQREATKPAATAPGTKPAATAPRDALKPPPSPPEGPGALVQAALAEPALQVMSSPITTSWLEDLAAFNVLDAEGYRREAERTRAQADEYRKLAEDARRQAEENRRRAADARRDGREKDAQDWEKEAERDEQRAGERDAEGRRIDRWTEEQERREQESRELAQERRDAAERAREQARQAERDRAERVRREAEEKARVAREEREARRAKEAADREARRQAAEDKERARQREIARQREAREREHRAQLDAEQRARDQRARGSSSDADLAKAAADRKKKKEEEEQASLLDRFADLVISVLDGNAETPEEKLLKAAKDKLQEKLEEKIKEEALKRTGLDKAKEKLEEVEKQLKEQLAEKLDDLGLDAAAGKLGEGVETLKKIKEIGDWMNAELDKNAGRQRRQMSKVDMLSDPKSRPERLRGASSGTIAGRDVLDVMKGGVEILKP